MMPDRAAGELDVGGRDYIGEVGRGRSARQRGRAKDRKVGRMLTMSRRDGLYSGSRTGA